MAMMSVRWRDVAALNRLDNVLSVLAGDQKNHVLRRAVNHTGDKARTQVVRALSGQTGLPYRVIRRAVKTTRANYSSLEYVLRSTGGDVSLKFFSPREAGGGVTARPFGRPTFIAGAFTRSGRPGRRYVSKKLGGHVYEPASPDKRWGRPIAFVNSGVVIPEQMVEGETLAAFERTVEAELPRRVVHELNRLTGGAFDPAS